MVAFDCPRCDEELEVGGSKAGKLVTCPACERRIRVPDDDYEPPPRRKKKTKRKKARSWQFPSARNVIFGVLFCLLGSIMVCGGLTSGQAGATIGGVATGIGLLGGGVYYFCRTD